VVCVRRLALAGPGRLGARTGLITAMAVAAALLFVTWSAYLLPLRQDGTITHEAFLTAPVDPKAQAWSIISAQSRDDGVDVIFCENWWICEPLRYFSGADPRPPVMITLDGNPDRLVREPGRRDFVVTIPGSRVENALLANQDGGAPLERWTVSDGQGRPAYVVFQGR
jgi:hypothetical protein